MVSKVSKKLVLFLSREKVAVCDNLLKIILKKMLSRVFDEVN